MVTNCGCGLPVARRTSWTHDNPGRKFVACKFFNHETGQRGCKTFEWVDREEPTDWQREVINVLVAEKHRVATDNHINKARLVLAENESRRLLEELEKLKNKPLKKKEQILRTNDQIGWKWGFLCVFVSAFVSLLLVKIFA